jgi:hypothetical protein
LGYCKQLLPRTGFVFPYIVWPVLGCVLPRAVPKAASRARSVQFTLDAAEDGAIIRAAEIGLPAAITSASNSVGVRYPKDECTRLRMYTSSMNRPMRSFA